MKNLFITYIFIQHYKWCTEKQSDLNKLKYQTRKAVVGINRWHMYAVMPLYLELPKVHARAYRNFPGSLAVKSVAFGSKW